MQSRAAALIGAAVIVLATRPAAASPLFELVGDAQGHGGLTARVSADGPAAAYFNPGLLAGMAPAFDLGVFVVGEQIGIALDGRGSSPHCEGGACDVPSSGGRGPESYRHEGGGAIEDPTLPTSWLQQGYETLGARPRQGAGSGQNARAYQTLGLIAPIFRGRLVLGMFAMIPLGEFTTAKAFYNDEREQFFSNSLHPELYGDRLTATSLAFGGGFKVHRTLSLGATFTLSLANKAQAPVYVSNLSNLDTVLLDSDIGVKAAVSPHFGAVWRPTPKLTAVATVHTRQVFEIETGFNYVLATGNEQSTSVSFTHSYMPLTVAVGGAYQLGDQVTLSALATYARWSSYLDRHSSNPSGEYAWSDTVSPAIGARYRAGRWTGWLDLNYQPTPVPPQTGRSNYVDNDRAGFSGGGEYQLTLWGSRLRLGLDVIGHRLFARHARKFTAPAGSAPGDYPELVRDEVPDDAIDVIGAPVAGRDGLQTNNPGFPGFGSSGWILGGGFHVAVEY